MLRILIVEDSYERTFVLERLYSSHRVSATDSAEEAIEFLESRAFDIIQLDYDLAGQMKGSDVAKHIVERKLHSLVLVQSGNPAGREEILGLIPDALAMPMEVVSRNTGLSSRLRSLLSDPALNSTDPIWKLLAKFV